MIEYRYFVLGGAACATASSIAIVWYKWNRHKNNIVFGRSCKLKYFMLKDSVTFCNHGSYSAAPRKVVETQRGFQDEQESNPEGWFRYQLEDVYSRCIDKVAQFVGSDKENLVLVENATSAINMVVKSLFWSERDKILITDQTYNAVKNTAIFISKMNKGMENLGMEIVTMDICFPIKCKQQLVDQLAETLDANKGIKLAILDHITSVSAILMPLEDMIQVCHQRGVMVLVDGAHAPGQIKLNLDELGADFYAGNLHKWCFATRGCCLLYIDPKYSDVIHPLVISHWQFKPRLRDRFTQQATKDYTSLCTATAAVEFVEEIGMDTIFKYNTNMVEWAAEMLSNAWGTPRLPVHPDMRAPFMALVKFPVNDSRGESVVPLNHEGSDKLIGIFYRNYNIHCACTVVDGSLWIRVSAQIYNCKEDYLKLKDAVLDFLKENTKDVHAQ